MFIPDPGKVIIDADLSGADAQVVAWEADDAKLKAAFRAGQSVHLMNGEDLLGAEFTSAPGHHKSPGTAKGRMYEALKRFVHGTNYLSTARNLALNPAVGWPLRDCESRQRRWFHLHPGIPEWHKRTKKKLTDAAQSEINSAIESFISTDLIPYLQTLSRGDLNLLSQKYALEVRCSYETISRGSNFSCKYTIALYSRSPPIGGAKVLLSIPLSDILKFLYPTQTPS